MSRPCSEGRKQAGREGHRGGSGKWCFGLDRPALQTALGKHASVPVRSLTLQEEHEFPHTEGSIFMLFLN